ncbi:Uncharacterized protein DBV15_01384 [Temnothorax longispinosus]|uniref:Uncharacterized protein n=1 Tax=Temnothorax longispinosus TaxID=300112 RepID=A0A4S2KZD6_9HYME|nr:Uncharacterized protein DBV15_01384 [Temnothorax longispinosus]
MLHQLSEEHLARSEEPGTRISSARVTWSIVLAATRGCRKALFYLSLSCILAWRPNKLWRLWLSYVAADLLAVLSLLHIALSALGRRDPCQSGADSVGESLLNSRQENYDRFEEVLLQVIICNISTIFYALCLLEYINIDINV